MRTILLLITALLAGCASAERVSAPQDARATASAAASAARPFVESGFLTDYSGLAAVEPGASRHVYQNPKADFSRYDKLRFDRITIWRSADEAQDVENADFQRIADDLYGAMSERLGRTFTLTEEKGPGVLRMRSALIAVKSPDDELDMYVTKADAKSAESKEPLPPGLRDFGRDAWVEAELLDAQTGEVLYAVVDRAAHVIPRAEPITTWGDLHRAFVAWADRVAPRLAALKERKP